MFAPIDEDIAKIPEGTLDEILFQTKRRITPLMKQLRVPEMITVSS